MLVITSTRRSALRAVLAFLPLLVAAACGDGGDAWRSPGAPTPPSTSTPSPTGPWKDLGEYTMTVTASRSCTLPGYAMTRTYSVRLKESAEHLSAEFGQDEDRNCVSWGWPCGFTGTRDTQSVRLTFNGDYPGQDGYAFSYWVSGENAALAYKGTATGKMDDGAITAMFDGAVLLYACGGFCGSQAFARCDAPDHRMELVRK